METIAVIELPPSHMALASLTWDKVAVSFPSFVREVYPFASPRTGRVFYTKASDGSMQVHTPTPHAYKCTCARCEVYGLSH